MTTSANGFLEIRLQHITFVIKPTLILYYCHVITIIIKFIIIIVIIIIITLRYFQ